MSSLATMNVDREAGLATLTLNRPETRNPTSIALLDAMDDALDTVTGDEAVRVLILAGAGEAFCAGLDLGEVIADEAIIRTLLRRLSEVMRRIRRTPMATIAVVQGAAIGGGFGFMAVADFAITHPEARIGYPPLEAGLSPALMAPWLVRKLGPSAARAMLMAGGTISGRHAFDRGLATHLVEEKKRLADASGELASKLLKGGPGAMRSMKTFLNDLDDSMADVMLDRAAGVSADVIASQETQSRLRRMFGKRAGTNDRPHGSCPSPREGR